MAEYRELAMVPASLRRSLASPNWDPRKIPKAYTLNKGHVSFFYNKRSFLVKRWHLLIRELKDRGYDIDPVARAVSFAPYEEVRNIRWTPRAADYRISALRILERYREKPAWYTLDGQPIRPARYLRLIKDEYRLWKLEEQ